MGSEMCIRDRIVTPHNPSVWPEEANKAEAAKQPISEEALNANPQPHEEQFEAILTPTDPPTSDSSQSMDSQ